MQKTVARRGVEARFVVRNPHLDAPDGDELAGHPERSSHDGSGRDVVEERRLPHGRPAGVLTSPAGVSTSLQVVRHLVREDGAAPCAVVLIQPHQEDKHDALRDRITVEACGEVLLFVPREPWIHPPSAAVAAVEVELIREDLREVGAQLRGVLTPAQNPLHEARLVRGPVRNIHLHGGGDAAEDRRESPKQDVTPGHAWDRRCHREGTDGDEGGGGDEGDLLIRNVDRDPEPAPRVDERKHLLEARVWRLLHEMHSDDVLELEREAALFRPGHVEECLIALQDHRNEA
mmetsp:Transcript_6320/g.13948  ORF Transcript_6320/g.13948 Transcript_6320/m.13948 type:complete len:289 (+) Transcript_6320:249-1115(+)